MTRGQKMLIGLIGDEAASVLTERLGGTRVYIPASPIPGSRLVLAIGHDSAEILCHAMPGECLHLPSRFSQDAQKRQAAIICDLRQGLPAIEVATRHGVTTSHVHALRAKQEH